MNPLRTSKYEVVARRRARLSDGWGWTGVYRAVYSIEKTVVGRNRDFVFIPVAMANGAAGSSGERSASRITSKEQIRYEAALREA